METGYELLRGRCEYCDDTVYKVRSVEQCSHNEVVVKVSCLSCYRLLDRQYRDIGDGSDTSTQ